MKFRLSLPMLLMLLALPAVAHDYRQGILSIDHPWSRPTPPGTSMGVGYMAISNTGDTTVTLVGARSTRAAHVSIHESRTQDGVMRMERLSAGLEIPAGETVTLKPHGYHLMLEKLTRPLQEGESIPLTLEFEGADDIAVELKVESLDGPAMPAKDGDMQGGKEMDHSGQGMNHSGD
ncbi:hypothetical protein SAMN04488073_2720 [Marinobacter gudaonensis]|uniref:Copper(I)-binding protein n=1 Tax=Marinobacter gudaonensis TaxID=375760 RepID=A0A1I6HL83_9GAMM|nr:copper chaperone PCu(A)C [Marinobacter gudaonensis]SFR55168.1 hypothetical protein SAMN04488073_2720 [Marinobacter gudaonensis]